VRIRIFTAACVALVLGLSAPAVAQPLDDDAADGAVASRYDSPEVVQKIRANRSHSRPAYSNQPLRNAKRGKPARYDDCPNCPGPRNYDSREVVKKVRNVDRSRIINTVTVVPARRRVKETNHLIVHQNETRETGVVQHNHLIIEKETRYVRRVPIETTVNFVTRKYRVVEQPDTITVPVEPRRSCGRGRYGPRHAACRPYLRVRG
jgi:hypothetical protein